MGKAYLVNELNNATFTNDILEDAVFFMFAEGGAMGEPGASSLLLKTERSITVTTLSETWRWIRLKL